MTTGCFLDEPWQGQILPRDGDARRKYPFGREGLEKLRSVELPEKSRRTSYKGRERGERVCVLCLGDRVTEEGEEVLKNEEGPRT